MIRPFLLVLFLMPLNLKAQTITGKLVRVIDGDDVLIQTIDSTFNVHLYGIDAPELGQTYCEQSVAHLESYLWNEATLYLKNDINQEGISAWVVIKRNNINVEMVRNGYAWYNRPHTINAELARSEMHASRFRLGLWKSNDPVAPWDFLSGRLSRPVPTDGKLKVLICTDPDAKYYHKRYCRDLERCNDNVIVILREQAKEINMKACRHCY
ncbi:MAG: thermonuclease family protein [Bacteroidales bacterium]|nr:thermonuclease family protein [Bacteroidales bacterium]